jgi:hypothetical protein
MYLFQVSVGPYAAIKAGSAPSRTATLLQPGLQVRTSLDSSSAKILHNCLRPTCLRLHTTDNPLLLAAGTNCWHAQ